MSSHPEQQTRSPEHVQKSVQSRPAAHKLGQKHIGQKAEPDAEDDVDTDPEDLQLEQQHAELYDSEADDKDQEWMQKQRQGRHSDAILSCPGCLTTVCIDCQRHEFYTTQYRAMFTMNCRVSNTPQETAVKGQVKLGKRQRQADSRQHSAKFIQETVYPVHCEICDAELGVQDADEVVHFYNAFPSTA